MGWLDTLIAYKREIEASAVVFRAVMDSNSGALPLYQIYYSFLNVPVTHHPPPSDILFLYNSSGGSFFLRQIFYSLLKSGNKSMPPLELRMSKYGSDHLFLVIRILLCLLKYNKKVIYSIAERACRDLCEQCLRLAACENIMVTSLAVTKFARIISPALQVV
ncbi:hypothetical protein EVAR_7875_1 [Eumeta japonica]|uniref:Uncharacterized protein n=1 Tax=Eumeta variegata TaxID=151549 RepID=A0A4C1TV27_EUMVA|nr:hypothetical protein EVAR_7875_1 [Eumeta japonica]